MNFINPKVKDEERSEWKEDLATREEIEMIQDGCRTASTGSIKSSGERCKSLANIRDNGEASAEIEQLNCSHPTKVDAGIKAHQRINDQPNGIPLLLVAQRKFPFQYTNIDSMDEPNLLQQRQRLDELHCQIKRNEAMLEELQHQSDVSFVSLMINNPENQRLYWEWRKNISHH